MERETHVNLEKPSFQDRIIEHLDKRFSFVHPDGAAFSEDEVEEFIGDAQKTLTRMNRKLARESQSNPKHVDYHRAFALRLLHVDAAFNPDLVDGDLQGFEDRMLSALKFGSFERKAFGEKVYIPNRPSDKR